MHLLIVDDEPNNLKLLHAQLTAEGHSVVAATNGVEALLVLAGESVDGVVSDILMPEMDGFRLCLEIRKQTKLSALPFIFYTSTYSSPQDQRLAKTVGADNYLSKPAPTSVILRALDEAMQKTRPRIAMAAAQHDESYVLKQYNASLVRKLEQRNAELEQAIKNLQIAHDSKQESEQRFRAIFDHAGIGIAMRSAHDRKSPWVQVNDHFCKLLGYSRDELLKLSTADITPDDEKASAVTDNKRLLQGDIANYSREKQVIRKDGQRIWVVLTVASLPGPDGRPANLIATYQDITQRKKADLGVRRLNRVYAVLSGVNSLIARVHDIPQLLTEACRIATEHGKFELAWIGCIEPGTEGIVPVAWAGENAETLARAGSSTSRTAPLGTGVTGTAIAQKAPVFINDLAAAPDIGSERRQEAIRLGYRSLISLPLIVDNQAVGALTLYVKEPNFFDDEEVGLLSELVGNISIGMESIARQHKIEKLSRIRSVSSEINAAIVRIRNRETLLRETCRITFEYGGFDLAWIGLVDPQKKEVHSVAWSGFPAETMENLTWTNFSRGQGALSKAMLTREPYFRKKLDEELPAGLLRQTAISKGYSSSACLPLEVDGRAVAVILLFAREEAFFDDDELVLLKAVAADVSFALQTIAKQEKLDYLSYYDPLTGLPNRTLFMDRAGQQMRSRGDEPRMVALVLINIERFRYINESFGRGGGDDLLSLVAQRLESAFHGKDYLARIGADGFGVVIRGIQDSTRILRIVEDQILTCFREPFTINGEELRVAAKIGVAVFPADGNDADKLYRNAEAALKKARESGERYLFYAAEMNARAAQTLTLESRLRRAVEAQEFVLHYQPKYRLADGKICGMEALIRWQDPASGLVPPATFIPLLEETGLILEVGKWALDNALAQHRKWTTLGLAVPRIAVNVSAIQLQQKNFADVIIDVVQKQGDNADALELEVTESLLMKNVQDSIRTLSILRGLGITIAMDDFGTGYSSLAYIARLPITSIKIDRSFITGMTDSPQSMNIVTTIIALAQSMNLKVVAEGVETEEQSQLLKTLGCDEAQGFLFSKPLPAHDVEAMLRANHVS